MKGPLYIAVLFVWACVMGLAMASLDTQAREMHPIEKQNTHPQE